MLFDVPSGSRDILTKKHDRFQLVLESEAVYLVLNPFGILSDPVAVQEGQKEIHKAATVRDDDQSESKRPR